jgi:hypothetical protein
LRHEDTHEKPGRDAAVVGRSIPPNKSHDMSTESRFKRVKGPVKTMESICMDCLHAVGVCFSEAELAEMERQHRCGQHSGYVTPARQKREATSI